MQFDGADQLDFVEAAGEFVGGFVGQFVGVFVGNLAVFSGRPVRVAWQSNHHV